MRKIWLIAFLGGFASTTWSGPLALLQGVTTTAEPAPKTAAVEGKSGTCEALPPAEGTKLGIIRQMLLSGRPHAAIAYLDAAHIDSPQSDLLRADGLRQTGRHEKATEIYRKLLASCVAGNAYQGLGLLAGQQGDVAEAVDQLQAASTLLPVDPDIRNDYGYALLLASNYDDALHEFLTAIELAPGNRQAAHNLLLLLYRTGQNEKAGKFAEQFGINAGDLVRLKEEAQRPLPGIALNDVVAGPKAAGTAEPEAPVPADEKEQK